ncbi:Mobile element protein [Lactococcus lactis subsp. lactis]|nr:Mobile element protein [Lactococcus lactis subsp. lactis]
MTYNSTLPKIFVYLLTTIETLYQTSVPLEVQNRKGSVAKFSKKSILV